MTEYLFTIYSYYVLLYLFYFVVCFLYYYYYSLNYGALKKILDGQVRTVVILS